MTRRSPGPMRVLPPLLLAAALAACSGGEPAREMPAIERLQTLVVASGEAGQGRAWDGVVEAVQQATLTAQTSGRVATVVHDVGDRVARGDVLLRLTAVEQQSAVDAARASLRAAEAVAREAEGNYRRYQELARSQYVSRAQLDQMRATRDSAVAARDAARAQLASEGQQADYTVVRAPYDGIVASRDVEPGESVAPGQPLMTVFAPGALRIQVSVPQSHAAPVRAAPRASVRLADGRQVEAARVTVFPAADPASHAVRIRVELPALDPAPAPGTTAKVVFPAAAGDPRVRIPASALVRRGELNAAYVLSDGRLTLRQLRLGARSGDEVEVISGLAPGETVAADPVAAAQALAAARGGD